MTQRAVFLTPEGVLCEAPLLSRPQDVHWLPGAVQALKWLHRAQWQLVLVSNQPGIARGLFGPAAYENLTGWMCSELANHGVTIAGTYHCPHLPDAPLAAWRRNCECRLPRPVLLRHAARDLGLDLDACVMMGHKEDDVAAARAAGLAACVLIADEPMDGSDAAAAKPEAATRQDANVTLAPDYSCGSLAEAAYWLLAHERVQRA